MPHNLLFYCFAGFGILMLGFGIVINVFNRKVGGTAQPTPWMVRVRQFQDERLNAGWRIQMISYQAPAKPMVLRASGVLGVVPAAGAFGFIGGLTLALYDETKYKKPGLIIAVSSFLAMLLGLWLIARREKQGWEVTTARCVDRELQELRTKGGSGWFWRIVCEYDHGGNSYRVTPVVYWMNFTSEKAARAFLEKRISPDGGCKLRVNPKNPLQTELVSNHC